MANANQEGREFPYPALPEGTKYPLDLDIYYITTIPDGAPHQASFMQGFAPSLFRNEWTIGAAIRLPSTIYDLTKDGQETLVARRIGGTNPINWHGQSPSALHYYRSPPIVPFNVIMIGAPAKAADYRAWADSCRVPPVLVAEKGGDLSFKELNPEALRLKFLARCDLLPDSIDPEAIATARAMLSSWVHVQERKLGYQAGGHNSVRPNLLVLGSAGYTDLVYGPFEKINGGVQPYVDQIVRTTKSVLAEREALGDRDIHRIFRPTMDLNLFAPAIYPHVLQMPIPSKLDRDERKRFQHVLGALHRQEGYSFQTNNPEQMLAVLGVNGEEAKSSAKRKPKLHPLMLMRARELSLATEAMALLAVSEMSAVVRLPNDVNRSAGIVRSFAQQYRGCRPSSQKRLFGFREVQRRLAEAVPPEFIDLVRQSKTGVRIVSDAHLEWLDIDGLPLAIRKNTCRIPVTPGNLFIGEVGPHDHFLLTPQELQHVLVISALKRSDPIKGLFEIAFDAFGKVWKDKLKIDFVEVASEQQFVDAINSFMGNIVVFDGHGAHSNDAPAALYLQDEPVNVWSLRDKIARMPPIVVLSACDTHAADRNHATVANGFLAIGARAVLASVFPLYAPAAATFTARLLYRLADYLEPAIKMFDHALSWAEVISGMIRMQLLTDFLRQLELTGKISQETYLLVHQEGNIAINGEVSDPFAVVVDALEKQGLDRAVILAELEFAVANSSAISYLQVGRPETILIDDAERARTQVARYG